MNDHIWHDQFLSRHRIAGRLKVVSPLRISSGIAGDDTDAPFIRDIAKRLYIPGTSLRGAVRSHLERVICGVGEDVSGIRTCTLFSENDCAKVLKDKISDINQEHDEKKRRDEMKNLIADRVCDLCRLFGNTMFASRIVFEDGHCEEAKNKNIIRDGVGIDRDSGAAAPTVKYDYEIIDPGDDDIQFSFAVTVENATTLDKKIIHVMLRLLFDGIYVGGKRAGGMGFIKLQDDVTVTGYEDLAAAWRMVMEGQQAATLTGDGKTWKEVFPC